MTEPTREIRLELSLEEFFAMAGAIGLLSASIDDPDLDAVAERALDLGERMAAKARARRGKRR